MKPIEVKQALASLVQAAIAGSGKTPFVEATVSDDKLVVGVRDQEGQLGCFRVSVEATDVPKPFAAPMQPQNEAGKVAPATDGDPTGTQTSGEAMSASPAQDEQSEGEG